MSTTPASREALLERTFSLFWRHLTWWLLLLAPPALSAALVWFIVERLLGWLVADAPAATAAALAAIPEVVAAAWLLAAAIGAQTIALRDADAGPWPSAADVFRRLAPRFPVTLATTVLVILHVAALGVVGMGAAAGLAALPRTLLPQWGVSDGAARSIALLVLLPLLVTGAIPVIWWVARHLIAIPLVVIEPLSPWAALREARAATRGRVWSVLGLLIVVNCASNVFVLLSRMAGSLGTLLVAPDVFRPIFGEGPLKSADGAFVQLGATLAATLLTLPLVLLPFSVLCLAFRDRRTIDGP